jgi:hypothetical protein
VACREGNYGLAAILSGARADERRKESSESFARGFHALSRQEQWVMLSVIGLALWATGVRLLWIVGAVAMYRAMRGEAGPGHRPTLVTFAGLVLALAWFARAVG